MTILPNELIQNATTAVRQLEGLNSVGLIQEKMSILSQSEDRLNVSRLMEERFNIGKVMQERFNIGKLMQERFDAVDKLMEERFTVDKAMQERFNIGKVMQDRFDFGKLMQERFDAVDKLMEERFTVGKAMRDRLNVSRLMEERFNIGKVMQERLSKDFDRIGDLIRQVATKEQFELECPTLSEQDSLLRALEADLPQAENTVVAMVNLTIAVGEKSLKDDPTSLRYRAIFQWLITILLPIILSIYAQPVYVEHCLYQEGVEAFRIARILSSQKKLLTSPNCVIRNQCSASTVEGQSIRSSIIIAGTNARILNKQGTAFEIEWYTDGVLQRGWINKKYVSFPK